MNARAVFALHNCIVYWLVVLALAWTGRVQAGQLFADDIAVAVDGEWRTAFQHILEPDGDKSRRPGTLNDAATRLRLGPTLWLNEFLSIETQFDANARWGSGVAAFDINSQASPFSLAVGRAAMHWQTPIGNLSLGRVGWHWGLGLFEHDGRTDLDRYGVPSGTGAQDMLRLRTAPAGVDTPFFLTVFLRQWFRGVGSSSDFVDNAWSYGAAIEGLSEYIDYGLLARFDRQPTPDTNALWANGYAHWRFWLTTASFEGGLRWGKSDGQYLVDASGLRSGRTNAKWFAGGAAAKWQFERAQTGRVRFETSGFELGILSGDDLQVALLKNKWGMLAANSDYKVGLLLLPQLWPARRASLAAEAVVRARERLPSSQAISDRLQETYNARSGFGGIANVFYAYPGFGLRTDDDLRFRLNFLYARSVWALPTLAVLDSQGTAQIFDDEYRRERELGFEIDTHLSYPLWGGVSGVFEAGLAFPGAAFVNAAGQGAPVAFTLLPRLTVSF